MFIHIFELSHNLRTLTVENELLALAFRALNHWALRFGFKMGVVLINVFLVCLESLPNFHCENPAAFHLISWQKTGNGLPQVHHSSQNAILTKLKI